MALSYYGTKISDNIIKTPEGFLICRNVPVARTGWQEYAPGEIGVDGSGMVKVHRHEDEVFHPATIASFEGKTVTDLHPSQWVDANNRSAYDRGHVQNVRRGTGDDSDLLLGDLFIKDAPLIDKITNGQREVSCGYDCDYEKIGEGQFSQRNIRGNHVAVVPNGRAGDRVAIRDHKPEVKKEKPMNMLKHLLGLGLKQYAQDAEPEKVAEAFEATKKAEERTEKRNEDACGKDADPNEHAAGIAEVLSALKAIEGRLAALESSEAAEVNEPESAIDAEIEKLEKGEEEETKDADLIPVETLSGDEIPENPISNTDAKLLALKALKPVIAGIPDKAERKKACDALLAAFRDATPSRNATTYADLLRGKKPEGTMDTKDNPADLGAQIKAKYHRKQTVR